MSERTILKKPFRLIAVIVSVLLALGACSAPDTSTTTSSSAGSQDSSQARSNVAPRGAAPSPSTTATGKGECKASQGGFEPTRYSIESLKANEAIYSLNLDKEQNIAAPPLSEPRAASWWNAGPKPGSEKGKVVLSIHTYRKGGALGNELYKGNKPQLKKGDLIKLYGADGQVQCYKFSGAKKVWVKDYDKDSKDVVDHEGKPQLVIVICWDFNKKSEEWDSRALFYGDPVTS